MCMFENLLKAKYSIMLSDNSQSLHFAIFNFEPFGFVFIPSPKINSFYMIVATITSYRRHAFC